MIRGYLTSGNRMEFNLHYPLRWKGTQGTETSKYLQESKEKSTLSVAASERRPAQTDNVPRVRPLRYRCRGTHSGDLKSHMELQNQYLVKQRGKADRRG